MLLVLWTVCGGGGQSSDGKMRATDGECSSWWVMLYHSYPVFLFSSSSCSAFLLDFHCSLHLAAHVENNEGAGTCLHDTLTAAI